MLPVYCRPHRRPLRASRVARRRIAHGSSDPDRDVDVGMPKRPRRVPQSGRRSFPSLD